MSDDSGTAAPPADADDIRHRHIRSFAMRRGHVTAAQKRAFDEVLPRVAIPYAATPLDLDAAFGRHAPRVLEIGFGMGDATARIAASRPDVDFLGVEVFAAGVGALCKRIDELALTNLRIVQHDAVEVSQHMVAPRSLAGVHIYFPDPWHKKRHHKRRLIQPDFVRQLVNHLAPGGYLHCATDWEPYARQMLEVLSAEPALHNTCEGYAPRPEWRPMTKFEHRGMKLGHGVWDLVFIAREP
jgi:tRNA (guanine-N7-)-methyltransferase